MNFTSFLFKILKIDCWENFYFVIVIFIQFNAKKDNEINKKSSFLLKNLAIIINPTITYIHWWLESVSIQALCNQIDNKPAC